MDDSTKTNAARNDEDERQFQARLAALAPTPWMTWMLIALNVLVWGAMVLDGADARSASAHTLLAWGGNTAAAIQQGEWWRLLTATFLHAGITHLAMNMLGLFGAGLTVERIYGHRRFLLIYLGAGLLGSALSLHFTAQQAISVGASGAVFGVTGALLVAVLQLRKQFPKAFSGQTLAGIGFFIVYSLAQGFDHKGIDNAAHVGGLIGGGLLAVILPRRFDLTSVTHGLKHRTAAALAVLAASCVALVASAPQTSQEVQRKFAGYAALQRGLIGFDLAMKAIQQEREDVRAGRVSLREADERSRTVHAPMFAQVLTDLSAVSLPPADPRTPLLNDFKRMTALIHESLAMESVFRPGSDAPEPIDPRRAAEIEVELRQLGARIARATGGDRTSGSSPSR